MFVSQLNSKAVRLAVRAGDFQLSAAQTQKVARLKVALITGCCSSAFPCVRREELALSMILNSYEWRSKGMETCQHKT